MLCPNNTLSLSNQPTPPPPPVATKQQYLCQPLLDAVMANIRSPVFNHSLYRTFAPAMAAIHGPPITYVSPVPLHALTSSCSASQVNRPKAAQLKDLCLLHSGPNISGRKRKQEDDERQTIPNVLQGEVARLDVKFVVNLDPTFCSNNGTVHLVCKLGESRPASIQPHPHIPPPA